MAVRDHKPRATLCHLFRCLRQVAASQKSNDLIHDAGLTKHLCIALQFYLVLT